MIINVPNFNPVAFSLSIIEVRWYSLAYIFGILYSYQFLKFSNKKYNFISLKALEDWMLYAILSILIGGRIGYVLFYNLSYFIENPIEILAFWHGGMSFHGGLIGAVLGMWLFSKKYNLNLWNILDNLAVSAPFALMLGRIANFINLELYGRTTSGNYGFIFPNSDLLPRHPSQLYQASLEGFTLFIILTICFFKTDFFKKPKKLSGIFAVGYGISRLIVEFFRQPDPQIGLIFNLFSMGQILSFPIIIFGFFLIFFSNKKSKFNI